ncbi:hypothetical protein, partial [Achromobacter ruhlandii]|uniref:hypothetical protein n=2 Tax=Achromobacter ruhlandii TaxID=72557 RepID=UPI003BA014AF
GRGQLQQATAGDAAGGREGKGFHAQVSFAGMEREWEEWRRCPGVAVRHAWAGGVEGVGSVIGWGERRGGAPHPNGQVRGQSWRSKLYAMRHSRDKSGES